MSVGCDLGFFFFFFFLSFFFFFFGLTLPNYRNKSGSAQWSPPSYQLLPPPLPLSALEAALIYTNTTPAFLYIMEKSYSESGSVIQFSGCGGSSHHWVWDFFLHSSTFQLHVSDSLYSQALAFSWVHSGIAFNNKIK